MHPKLTEYATLTPLAAPKERSRLKRIPRLAAAVSGFALLVMTVGFSTGLTGSNIIPPTSAGLTIRTPPNVSTTDPAYELGNNGTTITSVRFNLSPAVDNEVVVQLVSGGGWLSCVNDSGAVSCDAHNLPVADRDTFTVKVLP